MAQFKFFLAGSSQSPIVDVAVNSLSELGMLMSRSRIIEGTIVQVEGDCMSCGVIIPVGRIQFITEVDDD